MIKSVEKLLSFMGLGTPTYTIGNDSVTYSYGSIIEYKYQKNENWCICIVNMDMSWYWVSSSGLSGGKSRELIYRNYFSTLGYTEVTKFDIDIANEESKLEWDNMKR